MPRGAQVIYPKDAAQILMWGDVFPGRPRAGGRRRVGSADLLAAAGGRARRVGDLLRDPRRPPARTRGATSRRSSVEVPPNWVLRSGDLNGHDGAAEPVDRVVLDMLAPWECLDTVRAALVPGGVLVGYVATTTQLSRLTEALREQQCWTEPQAWEIAGPAVARGGPGGPAGASHDRSHSVPGHGPSAGRRGGSAPSTAPADRRADTVRSSSAAGDRHDGAIDDAASRCRPAE